MAFFIMPQKIKVETVKYKSIKFVDVEKVTFHPAQLQIVNSKVTAKIDKYLITPGSMVKKGQPIATIDTKIVARQIKQLEEGISPNNVSNTIRSTKEEDALLAKGIITKKEYAHLVNKPVTSITDEHGKLNSYVTADMEKQLLRLKEIMKNPTIFSTIDGRLASYYNPTSKIALADKPFAMIQQVQPLVATAIIPGNVDPNGLKAIIKTNRNVKILANILRVITKNSNGEQQSIIKISIPNNDLTLLPNTEYKVQFESDKLHKVLTLPQEAIHYEDDESYIYIVGEDNLIDLMPVDVSEISNGQAIISDHLPEDTKVVLTKGDFTLGEQVRF